MITGFLSYWWAETKAAKSSPPAPDAGRGCAGAVFVPSAIRDELMAPSQKIMAPSPSQKGTLLQGKRHGERSAIIILVRLLANACLHLRQILLLAVNAGS